MRAACWLGLASCVAALGCAERKAHLAANQEQVRLSEAPRPGHALQTRFGEQVELIGYDVDPQPTADRAFKVTWYWRVLAPLPDGFQLFTHLADAAGRTRFNLDSERALRRVYPEAQWKAGDLLRDEQQITLPAGWDSPQAVFYLGFYRGSERLVVSGGKHDAARRAEALRLPIGGTPKAEPPLPELTARKLQGALKLDGKLDEAAWQSAPDTGPLVNTISGAVGSFSARVRVLYDAQTLYAGFVVEDDYIKATFEHTDDHLWEQDTVEIMLDPEGDARNYFELQVSPRGVHFDTRYDAPRDPRPFGHVDWDSQVRAQTTRDGRGYSVELAVPFSAFAVGVPPASPPSAGSVWRVNLFVMDAREQGQRAVGWSPPRVGDFHTLNRFGRLKFEN